MLACIRRLEYNFTHFLLGFPVAYDTNSGQFPTAHPISIMKICFLLFKMILRNECKLFSFKIKLLKVTLEISDIELNYVGVSLSLS